MESGRGGMGSHKHGVSGHSRNNPVNLKQVARWLNARSDARAVLREQRRHAGMTGDIAAVFSPERGRKKKRSRKRSRESAEV